MRLRRLTLSGFKTFASRSEITFDRGITAIVGPNGSGKSNLVDAVRWALGETNARELRGQRMDEVVYAGGGRRLRTGVAEVELLIDNEEGRLAIEGVEVAVNRRVVRGAHDTEYRINGGRVRLRDLERLLSTTGLTQNGYAVVAQNDIDSIIEATPAQRRALVEQAAGVRALRAACEEVLGRVGHSEAVLARLQDLLADAEPRLEELEEQRAAALEQRELTARLVELRGSLAREEWRAARARLRQARRRHEQAAGRFEAAFEADAAFAERAAAERARLQRARALRDEAAARLEAARVAVERAEGEGRRLHDRLQHAVLQRALSRQELEAAAADVAALEASLSAGEAPRALVEAAEREVDVRSGAAADAAAALDGSRIELEAAEAGFARATAAAAQHAARLHQLAIQREVLLEERTRRQEQAAAAEADLVALERSLGEAVAAAETAVAASEAAARELAARRGAVEASWAEVNAADAAVAAASAAAREAVARAARLRGVVAGALGDGGVARAIAAGRLSGRRLSECFRVRRSGDEAAVAAALERHLGAWLVGDLEAAVTYLDSESDREDVLSHRARASEPAADRAALPGRPAIEAIDADPGDHALLALLLQGVTLVEGAADAAAALDAGAAAAVLPDGRVVSRSGVRGGGRPRRLLQLAAEERDARAAAAEATEREAQAITTAAAARERLAAAESDEAAAASEAGAADGALVRERAAQRERDAALTAAAQSGGRAADALRQVAERIAAVDGETGRLAPARAAADDELQQAALRRRQAADAVAARREELAAARREEHDAGLELARLREAAPSRTLDEVRRLLEGARRRAVAAEMRLGAAESEALAALVQGRPLRHRAAALEAAVTRARDELDTGGVPIAELERIVVGLENEHAEVAVALARAEDERATAQGEVDQAESEVDRLVDEAREDDDSAEWDPATAERAEREIVRLERRISALGAVNALAPEQHIALDARVRVLRSARDDIGDACADLRRMTRHLAADLERRFDAVFGAVSVHFQQVFAELFPGGRATLRLEEPPVEDDDEERAEALAERRPGVEILAQPPGKRLCPLRLLSGGERALTALATVLALQQVNPSPFYIFDEVDAALDDSNVLRFTRLLRRLAEEQQFIVVTHNHITMAAADVLWGVTIDGDGVSSVIGVRFDSAAPPEAALTSALRSDERRAAG